MKNPRDHERELHEINQNIIDKANVDIRQNSEQRSMIARKIDRLKADDAELQLRIKASERIRLSSEQTIATLRGD